jgi:hypothetical protein
MRYYFNLVNGSQFLPDETGVVLENPDTVPAATLMVLWYLHREDSSVADLWMGWKLVVIDEAGTVHLSTELELDAAGLGPPVALLSRSEAGGLTAMA